MLCSQSVFLVEIIDITVLQGYHSMQLCKATITHWRFLLENRRDTANLRTVDERHKICKILRFCFHFHGINGCRTPRHAQLRSSATAVRSRLIKWRFSCGTGTKATRFVAVARRSAALCCVHWRSCTRCVYVQWFVGALTPSLTLTGRSPALLDAHTR